MKLLEAWAEIRVDTTKLVRGVRGVENVAKGSARKIESVFKKISFKHLIVGTVGLYGLQRAFKAIISPAIAFEAQMAMVSTMLDETGMRILPQYSEQLKTMAIKFGESTSTLSKGLYDILSASIAPEKAMSVLKISAEAAAGGFTDTGTAAYAIAGSLNAYGLAAEKAGYVSDILFAIVKRGMTNFAALAPNIGKVATTAAKAGLSFEGLGAAIATITRAGISTEETMTAINGVLMAFFKKPGKEAVEILKKYEIELNIATLKNEGLISVLHKLKDATAEELNVMFKNLRGLKGIITAVGDVTGYTEDYALMLNSLGLREEAFLKRAKTTEFQLGRLKQLWEGLKITVGEHFLPVVNDITTSTLNWFEANKDLVSVKIENWAGTTAEAIGKIGTPENLKRMDSLAKTFGWLAKRLVQVGEGYAYIAKTLWDITDAQRKLGYNYIGYGGTAPKGLPPRKPSTYTAGGAANEPPPYETLGTPFGVPAPVVVTGGTAPTPPSYYSPGLALRKRKALLGGGTPFDPYARTPQQISSDTAFQLQAMEGFQNFETLEGSWAKSNQKILMNWKDLQNDMVYSWGDTMGRLVSEGGNFAERMDAMFKRITYSFISMIARMAAEDYGRSIIGAVSDNAYYKGVMSFLGFERKEGD